MKKDEKRLNVYNRDGKEDDFAKKAKCSISYQIMEILDTYTDESGNRLTQEMLASVLNVHQKTVYRWLKDGANIRACELYRLAKEANISVLDFFPTEKSGKEEQNEKPDETGKDEKQIIRAFLEDLLEKFND